MIKLRYNLWKMKRGLRPDNRFKESLRQELERAWGKRYGSVPWFQMAWFRYALAPAMAVVLVVFAGTSAYAYTSPEVVEGTLLYPIKTAVEKVEEKLSVTPAMKTKFYIRQLDRRYEEAAVVEKKVKKTPDKPQNIVVKNKMIKKINQVENKLLEQKKVITSNTKSEVNLKAQIQSALKESEIKKRLITIPTTTLKVLDVEKIRVEEKVPEVIREKLEVIKTKEIEKIMREKENTLLRVNADNKRTSWEKIVERAKNLLPAVEKFMCKNCVTNRFATSTPKIFIPTSTIPSRILVKPTSTLVTPTYKNTIKVVTTTIRTSSTTLPTTSKIVTPTTTVSYPPKISSGTIYYRAY